MQDPEYFSGGTRCKVQDWIMLIIDICFVATDCMRNVALYQGLIQSAVADDINYYAIVCKSLIT